MLKQKFLIQFGTNFGLKIFGMIAGIFVARYAGPEVLGTLAYGVAYVTVFTFIIGIFGSPHIKLISEGKPLDKCLGTFARLQLGSLATYLIIVSGWILFQKYVIGYEFESKDQEKVIWIFVFLKIVNKLMISSEITFIAKLKTVKANLPKVMRTLINQIGRVVIVILGYKAVALASWNLFAAISTLPLIVMMLKKLKWGPWDGTLAKQYIKYALPLVLYMIVGLLTTQTDQLLLQYYSNSTELGFYSAAFSLGGLILIFGNSMGQLFFPLFSSYISNNDWDNVNDKINKFHEFIGIFILPFVFLLVLLAEPIIITVLGKTYQPSIIPFVLLVIASFVRIWIMPFGNVITGKGKFYLFSLITFFVFLFFIPSVFIFIAPKFLGLGAIGLACNKLAVILFQGILFIIAAKRIGNIYLSIRNLYIIGLIILIGTGFYFVIPYFQSITFLWWLIVGPLFLTIVYGLLFLTKLMNKESIQQLISVTNIKVLKKYIKDELSDKGK
jgi:O-antigen/teichoic acid export membrane protein